MTEPRADRTEKSAQAAASGAERGGIVVPVLIGLLVGLSLIGSLAIGWTFVTRDIEPAVEEVPIPADNALRDAGPAGGEAPEELAAVGAGLAASGGGVDVAAADQGVAPAFDTLRASADGSVVVSGRAAPGAEVLVLVDEAEHARAIANARGQFVVFFDLSADRLTDAAFAEAGRADAGLAEAGSADIGTPVAASPVVLRLAVIGEDGTRIVSEASLIVTPATLQAAATDAAQGDGATMTNGSEADVRGIAADPAGTAAAEQEPGVLVADAEGVRLLDAAPLPHGTASIDSIGYDATGDAVVTGRIAADAAGRDAAGSTGDSARSERAPLLRAYLDNAPVADGAAAADGSWELALPGVAPGTYTLRIDVEVDGEVVARAETPFLREAPDVVAAAVAPNLPEGATTGAVAAEVVTVQPGFTLWAIARETYGDGFLYVQVFEANRDQIRNPDLIYPGQIFTIPQPE